MGCSAAASNTTVSTCTPGLGPFDPRNSLVGQPAVCMLSQSVRASACDLHRPSSSAALYHQQRLCTPRNLVYFCFNFGPPSQRE